MAGKILLLVLATTIAACASPVGDLAMLTGSWGGDPFDVVASASSIVIRSNCYAVTFPGPTQLIAADSFAAAGAVTLSSWLPDVGRRWKVWGALHGDTLRLSTSSQSLTDSTMWFDSNAPAILIAGQHRDSLINQTCIE